MSVRAQSRNGSGNLFVDESLIDLSPTHNLEFVYADKKTVNFLSPHHFNLETGLAYGTLWLTLTDKQNGLVKIGGLKDGEPNFIDEYDFTIESHRSVSRNTATYIGGQVASMLGKHRIHSYNIIGLGRPGKIRVWKY